MKETITEWRGTIGAVAGVIVGVIGAIGYFWVDRAIGIYCMAPEGERVELREKFDNRIIIVCEDTEDGS